MVDYENLYRVLFNGIMDAIEKIDSERYILAKETLLAATRRAEQIFIEED